MSDYFLTREFSLREAEKVLLRVKPPLEDGSDWRCDIRIEWPDRIKNSHAFGVDSVQALILALTKAHIDILHSPEGERGEVRWLDREDLGLPRIPSMD